MLGLTEIIAILFLGAIILFFGKKPVMEWVKAFMDIKKEVKKEEVKNTN